MVKVLLIINKRIIGYISIEFNKLHFK
jgi:hypothetical protein